VFIGPVRRVHTSIRTPLERLAALPNVHLLGERPLETLPGYVQHMDVALLPYKRNAYTDAINPMKFYEALAAGTPVVASPIRPLEDPQFRSVVTLARTADDWSAAM